MDSLSALLEHLDFSAEVFFTGKLCGLQAFDEDGQSGTLHFVRQGSMTLVTDQGNELRLTPSSLVFLPEGIKHRLNVKDHGDAELVCANVRMPAHQRIALAGHLPRIICIRVEDDADLSETARLLFTEAFEARHGRQIMINRLCDIFMIRILRYVIDHGMVELGLISGSTHPRLKSIMAAVHKAPERDWSLSEMAEISAMSRSKFSDLFKQTVGLSPMEYLTELRLDKARKLLKMNQPVSLVANAIGYDSASSLARVFKKRFGITPKQWIKQAHVSRANGLPRN